MAEEIGDEVAIEVQSAPKKPRAPRGSKVVAKEVKAAETAAISETASVKRRPRVEKAPGNKASAASAAARAVKTPRGKTAAVIYKTNKPATDAVIDDLADLIALEEENKDLRKQLAVKLRDENAELRKRLGIA